MVTRSKLAVVIFVMGLGSATTGAPGWTTVGPAASLPSGQVVHYCQGYEAIYNHNRDQHPEIREQYRRSLPAFVVSPHLADLLQRDFGRPARVVRIIDRAIQ